MIGVGRFLRSRFLKRLIQRDAGNEPRPQEAANVQFSHRLVMARADPLGDIKGADADHHQGRVIDGR